MTYIPVPARFPTPEHRSLPTHYTLAPISVAAIPRVPDSPIEAPAAHVADRHEASHGAAGRGAGWEEGTREDANRKAGGPFGIGDGLAAEGVTRHVVYVLDTSGSMKSRLGRAEDELTESLRGLRPGETFNIITFSGGSRAFDPDMAGAAPGNIQRASAFLSDLAAGGDTDLEDAIVRALMLRDVNEVVVLTDGTPTVGETDSEKLAESLRRFNLRHARISTIGLVGRNPDGTGDSFEATHLLQRIAHDSGGTFKLVNLGSATP